MFNVTIRLRVELVSYITSPCELPNVIAARSLVYRLIVRGRIVCVCVQLFVYNLRAMLPSVSLYGMEQRTRDNASVCVFIALDI